MFTNVHVLSSVKDEDIVDERNIYQIPSDTSLDTCLNRIYTGIFICLMWNLRHHVFTFMKSILQPIASKHTIAEN